MGASGNYFAKRPIAGKQSQIIHILTIYCLVGSIEEAFREYALTLAKPQL